MSSGTQVKDPSGNVILDSVGLQATLTKLLSNSLAYGPTGTQAAIYGTPPGNSPTFNLSRSSKLLVTGCATIRVSYGGGTLGNNWAEVYPQIFVPGGYAAILNNVTMKIQRDPGGSNNFPINVSWVHVLTNMPAGNYRATLALKNNNTGDTITVDNGEIIVWKIGG